MTTTAVRVRPRARMRIERGPFLVLHLALVVTIILWSPLGCRDSGSVSTVLPVLRPVVDVASIGTATAAPTGDRCVVRRAIVVTAVLAGLTLVAARRPTLRPAPDDHHLWRRLPTASLGSRAPPFAP